MVGWLTYGNKKFEALDSQMRKLIPPLRQAMLDFIPMVDADTNAFSGFMVSLLLISRRADQQNFYLRIYDKVLNVSGSQETS